MKDISKYSFGYIGILDILGFSSFSNENNNFSVIKSLMHDLYAIKKIYEYNFKEKVSIMSDTIIIMIEIDNDNKYDSAFFESLLEWISMIMITIRYKIGLFSRGAITIGNYYYDECRNIIFGPGIVRGATLAEKIDKISEIQEIDCNLKNRPAGLIIDNLFFNYPVANVKKLLSENIDVDTFKDNPKYLDLGSNYFLFNMYFSEYNYYLFGNKDKNAFNNFIKDAKARIDNQCSCLKFTDKYYFEKKCLDIFIENSNKH